MESSRVLQPQPTLSGRLKNVQIPEVVCLLRILSHVHAYTQRLRYILVGILLVD